MTQKLTIFGANLLDQSKGQFVAHSADCKDCSKFHPMEHRWTKEYASKIHVSADIWADMIQEGSMTAAEGLSEIHFSPCVKLS